MDLIGKSIGLWLARQEFLVTMALPPTAQGPELYFISGKIEGETPIGLLVMIGTIWRGRTFAEELPEMRERRAVRLIRWEFIRAAEVWDDERDVHPVQKTGGYL